MPTLSEKHSFEAAQTGPVSLSIVAGTHTGVPVQPMNAQGAPETPEGLQHGMNTSREGSAQHSMQADTPSGAASGSGDGSPTGKQEEASR